jgi:hypothetical protein
MQPGIHRAAVQIAALYAAVKFEPCICSRFQILTLRITSWSGE